MKFLCLALVIALGSPSDLQAELHVVSLSTITTDIATNVGGNRIKLSALVKPGMDPHEFQPSPADVKQIAGADLVLITGKHIEGYLTKLEQATGGDAKFVDTGKAIPSLRMEEEGRIVEDPHWWHSVENMKKAASVVRDAFIKTDPAHKTDYEKNAAAYLDSLTALKKWATETISELPRAKRKLVTSHDAFQYFAREYGFTVHPVEGIAHDEEPSSKKVAALVVFIKSQDVKSIFAENIENPKVITEITKETGAKLGGELYADGTGEKEAKTYIDMVRHNVTTVVEGLK